MNKEGSDKIRSFHMAINDILYANTYRYISPLGAGRIANDLTDLGVGLSNLEVSPKQQAKKDEILVLLRNIVRVLKRYHGSYRMTSGDVSYVESTLKFDISQFLKEKESGTLTPEKMLHFLQIQKQVYDEMITPLEAMGLHVNSKSYMKTNAELLEILSGQFRLS